MEAAVEIRKHRRRVAAWLIPVGLVVLVVLAGLGAARAATIVALGASNTFGKGVARREAYPAQLEALLRQEGRDIRVVNAGINGDTTGSMLRRLDGAVPDGTSIVILQRGGNDRRKGEAGATAENLSAITGRLDARGIKIIVLDDAGLRRFPHQPDGQHLTPQGYRMLAESLLPQVTNALDR
jgi:acyl-CoA thioesterase-1